MTAERAAAAHPGTHCADHRVGLPAVDPECDGTRAACAFRNPGVIWPSLPCRQRCLFGHVAPGSPEWYSRLGTLARSASAPAYLVGVRPFASAERAFAQRGLALDGRFIRSLFEIPPGIERGRALALLPKGARRDVRRALRLGIRVERSSERDAIRAFHTLYSQASRARGGIPLPEDFVHAEHERGGDGFLVLTARVADGAIAAAWVVVAADGWCRIVEGASDPALARLGPNALLAHETLEFALERGCHAVDFGISPIAHEGVRHFKRRMGFTEHADVVELRWQPAARGAVPLPPPRPAFSAARVDIPLLERCNFACGFCYREPWVPELDGSVVRRRIAELAAQPNTGIAFSGGEPTLRGDLVELVRYAREHGIADVQLHTNGTRAADASYAAALAHAGLTSAMVSLHSHRAAVFSAITAAPPESFGRTLAAIDNLRDAGVYVLLSHVINALNYRDLPDYMRFVARRFPLAELFVFFVYPSVKGQGHPHLIPRLRDVEAYWYEALEAAARLGVSLTVDSLAGFPLCYMRGYEHLSRHAFAVEQECATEGRVDDHLVKVPEMRHGRGCTSCRWRGQCAGFWSEYLDRFGDSELCGI